MSKKEMFKYPSINQFRQAIRNVKTCTQYVGTDEDGNPVMDHNIIPPIIEYHGTVKLHGTNGGLVVHEDGEVTVQSRNHIITPENDNAGFARFIAGIDVKDLLHNIQCSGKVVRIYGEWCGSGIQKGVALSELEKMFVIFSVKVGDVWLTPQEVRLIENHADGVYSIYHFPSFRVQVDFSNPEFAQNEMVKLVEAVEAECPVGKSFGVSGIGEGIVWKPIDPDWNSSKFWFKTKGEKHSVSKVKKIAAVDVEKIKTINEFVDKVVTPNRCEQSIAVLREGKGDMPIERKHMGDIIRWVYNDVIKEESDTIEASGLNTKELGAPIAKKTKEWFFTNELSL